MACPAVSGIAALLKEKYPSLNDQELRSRISRGARDMDPPGKDNHSGWGVINALGAYNSEPGPPPPRPRKYLPSESEHVKVTIKNEQSDVRTELSLKADKEEYLPTEIIKLSGALTEKDSGAPVASKQVQIFENNTLRASVTTAPDGSYGLDIPASTGASGTKVIYMARFAGSF